MSHQSIVQNPASITRALISTLVLSTLSVGPTEKSEEVRVGGTNDALQESPTLLTGSELLFDSLSQASRSREHEVMPVLGSSRQNFPSISVGVILV